MNKKQETKFEKCVVCGNLTTTTIDKPVNKRTNYIIGVGEVCGKCMLEVYCNIDPFSEDLTYGI